ncbi:MAG: acetate--CoA ligase family protein [Gemmatimonadota bacterium]
MSDRSLDSILRPSSVAVIGASRRRGTIGWQILDNLLQNDFQGTVYPVNPSADAIHSIRSYSSVADLPEVPDLAVVVVPGEIVPGVVEACGEAGVRGVVVISAGFREIGGAGVAREQKLKRIVDAHGMRMVGPNCMGTLNTAPDVSMNATFAPSTPPAGPIAFMSQSGAMGVTILDYASEYGFGISQFVSMGNKADVSGNDLLEYWRRDDDVGVILMYLENFGNPRRFTRIARRTTREKPVVAVKAGRTKAGARAASSHTGALSAVDVVTDALFAQCGVQRADTVEELFDIAMAFGNAPLPAGPRVAIVTNAGGPGIITADACEARGLEVAPLSERTQARLREGLPEEASVENPVDMIASADAEDYAVALREVIRDDEVDAVIAAFVPPLGIGAVDVARAIRGASEGSAKPVLAVLMGRKGLPRGMAELRDAGVPGYIFPESAARALSAMHRHRRWLERPTGEVRSFEMDHDRVAELLDRAESEGRELLTVDESLEVLDACGVPVTRHHAVSDLEAALEAAGEIGYPVVLKAVAPGLVHKTEAGAVELDLETDAELREAWNRIEAAAEGWEDAELRAVLVQEMVTGGRETIVGTTQEPNFGPLVMFGLGGVYVEALGDVTFRLQPVSDVDAADMVRSIRGAALLRGIRGEEAVALATIEETIQRVSQLVGAHPRIRELDVNPFVATPDPAACVAVDGRILLGPPGA